MSRVPYTRIYNYKWVIYVWCSIALISSLGCKKILDIQPNSNTGINPHLVSEFEQMLNNSALASPGYMAADLMSDDISLPDYLIDNYSGIFYIKAYQWWPTIWDATEQDPMYAGNYQMILQSNIILDRINAAPDGSEAQKNRISAEAKIHRAYYYFQLANLYGSGYNINTANSDLAVPLILKPDPALLPTRATVQQVYDQILRDLQDAISTADLQDFGIDVIHPGRAAALALQARTYLFMGNYAQALASANAALQIKNTVLDYNNFQMVDTLINDPSLGVLNRPLTLKDETNNPETLLARVSVNKDFYTSFYQGPWISDELRALLGNNDLRLLYNFKPVQGNSPSAYFDYYDETSNVGFIFNCGIGVPEMLLIKAECLARQGEAADALSQLELIRKFRYKPEDYVELSNTGAEAALKQVLDERRRELFLHGGLRLFDLKRLNQDSRFMKDVVRISDTDGSIIATLNPGSPRYLMPFAPQIISINPNIIQNPR